MWQRQLHEALYIQAVKTLNWIHKVQGFHMTLGPDTYLLTIQWAMILKVTATIAKDVEGD